MLLNRRIDGWMGRNPLNPVLNSEQICWDINQSIQCSFIHQEKLLGKIQERLQNYKCALKIHPYLLPAHCQLPLIPYTFYFYFYTRKKQKIKFLNRKETGGTTDREKGES